MDVFSVDVARRTRPIAHLPLSVGRRGQGPHRERATTARSCSSRTSSSRSTRSSRCCGRVAERAARRHGALRLRARSIRPGRRRRDRPHPHRGRRGAPAARRVPRRLRRRLEHGAQAARHRARRRGRHTHAAPGAVSLPRPVSSASAWARAATTTSPTHRCFRSSSCRTARGTGRCTPGAERDEDMPPLFARGDRACRSTSRRSRSTSGRSTCCAPTRYGDGRVFIAGDAAHLVIPTGGLGMNTGVGRRDRPRVEAGGHRLRGLGRTRSCWTPYEPPSGARSASATSPPRAGGGRARALACAWSPAIAQAGTAGEARAPRQLAAVADREQRGATRCLGIEARLPLRRLADRRARRTAPRPTRTIFAYAPTTWPGARLPHVWLDDGSALHDRPRATASRCCTTPDRRSRSTSSPPRSRTAERRSRRSPSARPPPPAIFEGHALILVRPDLHVAWRGHDSIADPAELAALATGARTPIATAR